MSARTTGALCGALGLAATALVTPSAHAATTSDTAVQTATSSSTQGSLPVGQASYPVPSDAIHVSPTGSDSASGASGVPLRTVAAALQKAGSGATIVLHAGIYHEADLKVPQGHKVTIQNAPGEAAWLDGARTVSGFTAQGSTWVKDGWNVHLDHSPTYTRGASDDGGTWWKFLNDTHPMAAHPDQVWVNGARQRQVASASQVTNGTFYVDEGNNRLVLGTNPNGAEVVAIDLADGLTVLGDGTTIRGIGLRNYGNAVPDMGALTLYARNVTLENVQVLNAASGGIGVFRSGATLNRVTVRDAGQIGIQGNEADGITMDRVTVTGANAEHFNPTPAAGAIKFTRSRGITLRNSQVTGADGNGVWVDESSYDLSLSSSTIADNTGRGVFVELSEKAVVVNNRIADNGGEQVRIGNSARVQLWNNVISGATIPVQIAQDARTASNTAYAVDTRRPSPDPEMTWLVKGTTIGNNVIQSTGSVSGLLMVEDYSKRFTGSGMVASDNGNVFSRAGGPCTWVVVWANRANNPKVYTQLGSFVQASGREGSSQYVNRAVSGRVVANDAGISSSTSVSVPSDVTSRAGVSAPSSTVGAWS